MSLGSSAAARATRLAALSITLAMTAVITTIGSAAAEVIVNTQSVEERTAGFDLSFAYPQIGIPSDDATIQSWVQSLIAGFKNSLTVRSALEPPYSAQLTYTVPRNDAQAVVIVFNYSIYTGGAHPNSAVTTFNFLLPDGTRVFLPDLIGNDAINRVSDLAIADLSRRLETDRFSDPDWIRTGAGPYADNFENFEWLPSQLVVHFDPYVVGPYAAGPQEVRIPLSHLQDVLRPDPRAPLPSFDCTRATTDIELAICADQALAQLDRRVAEAYAMRLRLEALGAGSPLVTAQQVEWLADRDVTCGDAGGADLTDCLKDKYAQRLVALRNFDSR